jgi:hypothetical protein
MTEEGLPPLIHALALASTDPDWNPAVTLVTPTRPAPPLPPGATPQMVAMNDALWAWVEADSFRVKVGLMVCIDDHEPEVSRINRSIATIARAWGELLDSLS